MTILRALGSMIFCTAAGLAGGLTLSVVVFIVWGAAAVVEIGRSPGNDPLVPLMIVWVFVGAPAGSVVGGAVGLIVGVMRATVIVTSDE